MLSNEFDYQDLIENSQLFGIKRFKDAIFRGEIDPVSNIRHGKGVNIYENGRIFEGDWFNDKRHGRGFEKFPNGNVY